MKQFKCSMSKKKEAVSRGSRDLLDNDELTQTVQGIYENELNKLIDGADEKEKPYYQSVDYVLEDYIPNTVETIQEDMYKYVSGGEYAMPNNWRQINLDWDRDHKDGIKFSALREKLLDGVNDADTEEFSQWGIDWFFKAFGTFGLKYNFREAVTDIVYNDMAEDGVLDESKKSEDFDMNKAFFQAKKAITDWTKKQGHKTLEWLYTDGRKSPTSYPSGIWDFEWDTGNGMATAELKVSPYETRTNSWNDSMDFSLRVGTEDMPMFYTSVEDVLSALDTLISKTEIKMESKKSEGISDMIDAKINYNMFMRMCKTAAYLEEDEDYWDALWEYYSDLGSIGDALVFFDNLFQYTAWKDVDETYDELKDEYKDESKNKEECIEKAIDEGALDGVYPYGDHYLWIY